MPNSWLQPNALWLRVSEFVHHALRSFEKLRLLNPPFKTGAVPVPLTEVVQPLPVIGLQVSKLGKFLQFGQHLNGRFILLWLFHFHEGFNLMPSFRLAAGQGFHLSRMLPARLLLPLPLFSSELKRELSSIYHLTKYHVMTLYAQPGEIIPFKRIAVRRGFAQLFINGGVASSRFAKFGPVHEGGGAGGPQNVVDVFMNRPYSSADMTNPAALR